jgi:hypothetical protein
MHPVLRLRELAQVDAASRRSSRKVQQFGAHIVARHDGPQLHFACYALRAQAA